jgi:hypothetical protein
MTTITWFKAPHGLPADERWPMIAKRAGGKVGEVVAIVSALWDFASRNDDRGSVQGFDPELVATLYDFEQSKVEAILTALVDKAVIVAGRLADWARSQGAAIEKLANRTVAASTERVRRHRRNKAAERRQGDLFAAPAPAFQTGVTPVSSGVSSAIDLDRDKDFSHPPNPPLAEGGSRDSINSGFQGRRAGAVVAVEQPVVVPPHQISILMPIRGGRADGRPAGRQHRETARERRRRIYDETVARIVMDARVERERKAACGGG